MLLKRNQSPKAAAAAVTGEASVPYTVPRTEGEEVLLSTELVECGELFFDPKGVLQDNDSSICSLAELVAEVIDAVDIDLRRQLLSKVLVCGGSSLLPGFSARLARELKNAIPHCAGYLRIEADEGRGLANWHGGRVLGDTSVVYSLMTSADDYFEDDE